MCHVGFSLFSEDSLHFAPVRKGNCSVQRLWHVNVYHTGSVDCCLVIPRKGNHALMVTCRSPAISSVNNGLCYWVCVKLSLNRYNCCLFHGGQMSLCSRAGAEIKGTSAGGKWGLKFGSSSAGTTLFFFSSLITPTKHHCVKIIKLNFEMWLGNPSRCRLLIFFRFESWLRKYTHTCSET